MRHPREHPLFRSPMNRRDFIRRSAVTTAGFSSMAALLAACGGGDNGSNGSGIEIASRENPSTLPLSDDNPPIKSGLDPEAGPLKIYNWADYVWPKVVKDFADRVRRRFRDHDASTT